MKKRVWFGCICGLTMMLLGACSAQTRGASSAADQIQSDLPYEETRELIGTTVMVRAYGNQAEEAVQAAFSRAEELELVFSNTKDGSEVNAVNMTMREQPGEPVTVSENLADVLQLALHYGTITNGALNCTMGKLIDLWGIGTEYAVVPSSAEIQALLPDQQNAEIQFNAETRTITALNPNASLQFGAIAKGYIADEMEIVLESYGISSALMSLGGNIATMGTKPDGGAWSVAVTDPFAPDQVIASVQVMGQAVVTSGNYEKYFMQDGKRYHHILDPATGYPAEKGLVSVTILSDRAVDCDALSTAVYVLGAETGLKLVQSLDGIEAILIQDDGSIVTTDGVDQYQFQELTV